MLRITLTAVIATTLLAGSLAGAAWLRDRASQRQADLILHQRLDQLAEHRAQWRARRDHPDTLPGARHAAGEALETLDLLRELYAQEERLWSYYDALDRSQTVRAEFADERGALERRLADQRAELGRLEAALASLRPDPEPHGIRFEDADHRNR